MQRPEDEARRADLRGHVASERGLRLLKARKIEHLLDLPLSGKDVLDLGTGAGVIAEFLASRGAAVTAADRDIGKFEFGAVTPVEISGAGLPFPDDCFDIVVFNHVIEHIGDRHAQKAMLTEVERCLRPGGVLYLAVPNKWALIEPHFRLPLLGALPRRIADWLVRALGQHQAYDCYPFGRSELLAMIREIFACAEDVSAKAYYWVAAHEIGGPVGALLSAVPRGLAQAMSSAYPTLILLAKKRLSS